MSSSDSYGATHNGVAAGQAIESFSIAESPGDKTPLRPLGKGPPSFGLRCHSQNQDDYKILRVMVISLFAFAASVTGALIAEIVHSNTSP